MSVESSPASAFPSAVDTALPTDALAGAARKALDLRVHPGGFHERIVVRRQPSPRDIEILLEEAASSQQRVVSHARAHAARLLRHLSVQPWSIDKVEASGGLGAPCQITLRIAGARAVLELRALPLPHLSRVRY